MKLCNWLSGGLRAPTAGARFGRGSFDAWGAARRAERKKAGGRSRIAGADPGRMRKLTGTLEGCQNDEWFVDHGNPPSGARGRARNVILNVSIVRPLLGGVLSVGLLCAGCKERSTEARADAWRLEWICVGNVSSGDERSAAVVMRAFREHGI